MAWSILRENRKDTLQRRKIVHRLEGVSYPIMRWSNGNDVPQPLDFICRETQETYQIVTPTHGFEPQDVYVALSGGHVIVLLKLASRGQPKYYREIQIPAEAKRNRVLVEINCDFITITLRKKKSNLLIRIATEIARLGTDYGLPYGKVQQLQHSEDFELR